MTEESLPLRGLHYVERHFRQWRKPEAQALRKLRRSIGSLPRFQRGRVEVWGWDLEFVDASSCISMFDHIVVRRWNDFTTNNPKPKILDCGANIGISVLHYKRLFPEARIIAFEPDPEICQVLRRNLRVNNAEDVQVVETALWDTDGEMSFDPDGADGGRLGGNGKGGVSYRVKTERLVRYLNEPVDLLKLDIEGAEGHVIRDCGSYLRNVDNIVLEYHVIANKEQDLGNLLLMLTANGFRYYINSFGSWLSLTTDLSEIGSSIEQLLMISARSRWDHT